MTRKYPRDISAASEQLEQQLDEYGYKEPELTRPHYERRIGPVARPSEFEPPYYRGTGSDWYRSGLQHYEDYSGRGPKGYRRSDERIREDVCERLTEHPGIDASDIEVEVKEREVTLNGNVPDRRMKRLAEDIAESVGGVVDIHNFLRIGVQLQEKKAA
jgi:hypothetical protein